MLSTTEVNHKDVLKNKALMVKLNRSKFNNNKTDKLLSQEISKLKNVTEAGACRVNKSILPREVLKEIGDIYSKAGKYYYTVTLPWDDQGFRLLSIDLFDDFRAKFKDFTNKYREKVVDFVENIQSHVEASKEILGDAWNADDYEFIAPNGSVDKEWLMNKFNLHIEYDVVTSGDDLRACLTEEDREAIAAEIDAQAMKKFTKANKHIIVTLRDHILAIHERLCKSENIFRDTLISNLEDLVDLIPKMNMAGDPELNALAAEAKERLSGWNPQDLRDDEKLRKKVDSAAKDILNKMDGLI